MRDAVTTASSFLGSLGVILYGPHIEDLEGSLEASIRIFNFWTDPAVRIVAVFQLTVFVGGGLMAWSGNPRAFAIGLRFAAAGVAGISESCWTIIGLSFAVPDNDVWRHPWILIALVVATTFSSLASAFVVNYGARHLDHLYYVPAYTCLLALTLQVNGLVQFKEHLAVTGVRLACFVVASLFCIASVILGSGRSVHTETAGVEDRKITKERSHGKSTPR